MRTSQRFLKRAFDIAFSIMGLLLIGWLIIICWLIASADTGKNGFFIQKRVGKHGKLFSVMKIRTMREVKDFDTTITVARDPRISFIGAIFRKFKLDELPQLFNVLVGKMSFVGPRPDVAGYADVLEGPDRLLLDISPGITGPASFYFRNEENLLAQQEDPIHYNDTILWPQKVKINLDYIHEYTFWYDIQLILATVSPLFREKLESKISKIL